MKISTNLLLGCARGERRAQEKLYKLTYGVYMGIALRYVVNEEDGAALINQAFLKIFNGTEKFLSENPADKFEFWSRRIMINTVIDDYRRNKKHKDNAITTDFSEADHLAPSIEWNEAESQLAVEDLHGMLNQLPELRRKVFNLYAIDGYPHKEIADMLGIKEGNSKWHLSTARKELRLMLAESLQESKLKIE